MLLLADHKSAAPPGPARIGGVTLDVPVMLAPMSGVSDLPFRRMVRKSGAALTFTEMIASREMVRQCRKTRRMALKAADEGPVAVQLAGCDPEIMAEAARLNEDAGADIIDLNFGCPVKKIVNGHAGSYLMRDEVHAARLIAAVVKAVRVPVTLKMRLGWDRDHMNAPRLAKIAEECGARMVTVHGRTRDQLYGGEADWSAVRAVKEAVAVPVIVNGDIRDFAGVTRALELSAADGVMIGRGACGRPWFIGQTMAYLRGESVQPVPFGMQCAAALEHHEALLTHYGERAGVRIARKHMAWYTEGLPGAEEFRRKINGADDAATAQALIRAFYGWFDTRFVFARTAEDSAEQPPAKT